VLILAGVFVSGYCEACRSVPMRSAHLHQMLYERVERRPAESIR
jgi:hypothetical protein